MPIGDGIRRNIATVSVEERTRFRDAIVKLDDALDPAVLFPDGVTFWDKQQDSHVAAHVAGGDVHGGPAFLAWHRELCNRFEQLLRTVDPQLSLHYWDWTTDPRATAGPGGPVDLMTPDFMGSANGDAGPPFANFESSEGAGHPVIWRNMLAGVPAVDSDATIVHSADGLPPADQYDTFNDALEDAHDYVHASYVRGTIGNAHVSFHDPFVFLLHANVDRLWAMWQRQPGQEWRLDPEQTFGSFNSDAAVNSPMEPWNGAIEPWTTSPEPRTAKDLVSDPPSYDTAPHSSYLIVDRDTFSEDEVQTLLSAGPNATFAKALYVVYEGFRPQELGEPVTPPALTATFDNPGGSAVPNVSFIYRNLILEHPASDQPQRVTFEFDIRFSSTSAFSGITELRRFNVRAVHGTDVTDSLLTLLRQPNPYMIDGAVTWLSTDVRVFQIRPGWVRAGVTMGSASDAPFTFIQALTSEFNSLPNDEFHPFRDIAEDQEASALELSRSVNGQRVYNFAVAKVRYRSVATPANDVKVFFRTFNTLVSALDYNVGTNYRRTGSGPTAVPLLGIQSGQVASIPYFAEARIDSASGSMASQPDVTNQQPFSATGGAEGARYFGCWLDFNQTEAQFPLNPGNDGPFTNRLSIQELMRGTHQCMVAEIHFHPGAIDPINTGATPGSSARIGQRNLAIVESDNPGGADSHKVQHTFMVKPSLGGAKTGFASPGASERLRPDELMIRWNNVPRDATANLYFPEITADAILTLANLRQRPDTLGKVDENTISCRVTDVTFIPLPGGQVQDTPVLMSIQLPQTVVTGQTLTVDVRQFSGRARKILGAFQITIPVSTGPLMLPKEIRKLSVLKHIFSAIPTGDRWHPVFVRYLGEIEDKIRDVGGDPDSVHPSPDGTGLPTPSTSSRRCWTLSVAFAALLALLIVLTGVAPVTLAAPLGAAGLVVLIALGCWWLVTCRPKKCALLQSVHTGFVAALFVLGILMLFGFLTPKIVAVTAITAILDGVALAASILGGCCGACCTSTK